MILRNSMISCKPGWEADPWASQPPSEQYSKLEKHSYLQSHFMEVAPGPSDDVPQEEDGAVGMLRAVAAAFQVGLVVGCQHIHPACGKRGSHLVSLFACLHSLHPQGCRDKRFLQHPTSRTEMAPCHQLVFFFLVTLRASLLLA